MAGAPLPAWWKNRMPRRARRACGKSTAVGHRNAQGEQYLTDVVRMAADEGLRIAHVETRPDEIRGVNTPDDLAFLETLLRRREDIRS